MLRVLRVLALLIIACPVIVQAEKVEDLPQPQDYVSDFAGVLSSATRQQLDAVCGQLDHQANAQLAIVTIKTLEGDSIEDFATALEEKWKVGPKGSDRGAILILATDDHKYRIEVGYGLEGILPDGLTGNIGRQMVPYLKQGDYDQAVSGAVNQIAQVIAADAHITLQANPMRGPPPPQPQHLGFGGLVILAIIFFAVIFLLSRLGGSGLLGFLIGTFLGGGWGGGGGPRGGGGFGGGGGGFGGFGGGSSGGGGASGSW